MALNIIMNPNAEYEKVMENNQMALVGREAIRDAYKDKDTYHEWGSGGSTLWHIQEQIEGDYDTQIIAVEHDMNWYNKIDKTVRDKYTDIDEKTFWYLHKNGPGIQMQNGELLNFVGTPIEEFPVYLTDYIEPPELDLSKIDVFLVDGLARACTMALLTIKAKVGATVFLHDIEGREEWYRFGTNLLETRSEVSYVYHNMVRYDIKE